MKTAIIIGAGPAGLTAAYQLLTTTDILPIIIESDAQVGGLSKTVEYKGNRIDIGGHRFFSKSSKVLNWWLDFLPLEASDKASHFHIQYHHQDTEVSAEGKHRGSGDNVMMVRPRKSRIYYHRRFFDYPLQLNGRTIRNLGLAKMLKIISSYTRSRLFPIRPEVNLAEFFINRFGKELYTTFFRDYTQKVWGVACESIPADWGRQRVKNLDIAGLIRHALGRAFRKDQHRADHTSLIEQFLYPKYGPGQMWEAVAAEVKRLGGEIRLNTPVIRVRGNGRENIEEVEVSNGETLKGDYFLSTMPVKDLVAGLTGIPVAERVKELAGRLAYRDFLIVGILTSGLTLDEDKEPLKDNWLYIQDKEVMAGRVQLFHNWSPYLINDPSKTWIGVEYFCNEPDDFWQSDEETIKATAIREMESIGILKKEQVLDAIVVKVAKAYPSYYGAYEQFGEIRSALDTIDNLYLIGRNGMHRYNNTDHSMLTAMAAVDNIRSGRKDKANIWNINTEDEYHEEA